VVSASGSVKSSLVAAGLLPRLKARAIAGSQDWLLPHMHGDERREWTGLRFTPGEVGDNPFLALAVRLAPMVGQSVREVGEELASAPERLAQWCEDILTGQPEWAEVLVFIDQFEELFTLVRDDVLRQKYVAMLPHVFRELVEVDERGTATRQRAPLAHFEDNNAAWTLLEKFTDARLLTASGTGYEAVVEVAHGAIFRHWERLAEWIKATQNDLILRRQVWQAVQVWEQNQRSEDYLWTGQQLKNAQAMAERLDLNLSKAEAEFLRSEVERLEEKLINPELNHLTRAMIGEQLHTIGDTRPGVGLRSDGLPDMVWCAVPGGEVTLREMFGEIITDFPVRPFYIAKYPVTFIQFQAFLDDPDGFDNEAWWLGLVEVSQKREMEAQRYKFANPPRDNMRWYQAVAFCHWLNAKLPGEARPEVLGHQEGPKQWGVRLPTEWEWQQAATGGNPANEYPWGANGTTAEPM
jgi:hypothetical protein